MNTDRSVKVKDIVEKFQMEVLYPGIENFAELYNAYAYRNLDQATLDYVNTLWEQIKIN